VDHRGTLKIFELQRQAVEDFSEPQDIL